MRTVKILFSCHLIALVFALCGLLLLSPHSPFWNGDPALIGFLQFLLHFSGSLQILFGAATMLFFGWLCVGPRKTLMFFAASLLVSFLLGLLIVSKTVLLGVFAPDISS